MNNNKIRKEKSNSNKILAKIIIIPMKEIDINGIFQMIEMKN